MYISRISHSFRFESRASTPRHFVVGWFLIDFRDDGMPILTFQVLRNRERRAGSLEGVGSGQRMTIWKLKRNWTWWVSRMEELVKGGIRVVGIGLVDVDGERRSLLQRVWSIYLEQDGRPRSSQPVRDYRDNFIFLLPCTILVRITFRRVFVGSTRDANSVYSHVESSHHILGIHLLRGR